jgi:hypothetical protein
VARKREQQEQAGAQQRPAPDAPRSKKSAGNNKTTQTQTSPSTPESKQNFSRTELSSPPDALLVDANKAAELLAISTKTLRRLRNDGLQFVVLTSGTIRYRRTDLEAFIGEKTCRFVPKIRATGTTTSRSGVVDFMAVAKPTTMKKPKP